MSGYSATLIDGREIYIPAWPINVALENLASASKYLGAQNVILISELKLPSVIVGIMESEDPKQCANLIKHFVCQVRIDGKKIEPKTIESMFEGELSTITEIFAHVIHSQYSDFFVSGLAKAPSQNNSKTK